MSDKQQETIDRIRNRAMSRDLELQNEKEAARIAQQAQTQLLNMGYNWNQLTLTWIKPEQSNNVFAPKRYLK